MRESYDDVAPRYGVVKRGKLVTFYKNGDPHFKGLQTSVSGKHFVAMHTLLSWLNDKIDTINGVKHIFTLPDGREINEVTRFEAGGSYVVSSVRPFLSIPYGLPRHRLPRHEDRPPQLVLQRHRGKTTYLEVDEFSSASDELYGSPSSLLPVLQPHSNHTGKKNNRGRNHEKSSNLLEAEKIVSPRSRSWGSPTRTPQYASGSKLALQDSLEMPASSKSSIINEMREELSRQSRVDDSCRNSTRYSAGEKDISGGQSVDRANTREVAHHSSDADTLRGVANSKRASLSDMPRVIPREAEDGTERQERRKRKHEAENKSQSAPLDQFNQHQNIWSPLSFQGEYYAKAKPRLLLIISNTDRSSRQRVIFNPRTLQSFEEVLIDIARIVRILHPPVTALYTARPPYVKVMGISHLTRALKNCDELLACGSEQIPIEMQSFSYLKDRIIDPYHPKEPAASIRSSKSLDYINSDALLVEESSRKKKKVPTATLR